MKDSKQYLILILSGALLCVSFLIAIFLSKECIPVVSIAVWLSTWLIWFKLLKRKKDSAGMYFFNFMVLYIFIVVGVILYDRYLDYKIATFDIDHDGVFSSIEQTPEQKKYMRILINDLGRNLTPLWGIFISLGSTIVLLAITKLFQYLKKK